jgi:hypothetical protein
MRYRWTLVAVVVAALIAVGGVAMAWQRNTGPPSAGPISPGSPRPSSSTPTSPSPNPRSSAEQESADRAAVEQAWQTFWTVRDAVESGTVPQSQWPAVVGAVAVDPTYTRLISAATQFRKSALRAYGAVMFHPYWSQPIAGKPIAVMGDCMDTSQHGSLYVTTGDKRSVGVARDNTRATFVRGTDDRWRVKLVETLVDQKC